MLERKSITFIIIFLSLSLWGCGASGANPSTPTRSSQDVLGTAQALAEQTRQATMQTVPPTPVTPSPTVQVDTPTPEPTQTPDVPIVTADFNAFVRAGPDESYENIDFFLTGQTAEVIGRYENETNGTWWYIRRIGGGKDGWVWSGAVTLAGNAIGVPGLEPPKQD